MAVKGFKEYLVREKGEVWFTFGRMNPPTVGHGKVMDVLKERSGPNDYRIYLSHSHDPKRNPLKYSEKVKLIRKMFPRHARRVLADAAVRDVVGAMSALYEEGWKNVVMVAGSDRLNEYEALLKKYNGKAHRKGFYNFESISVVSSGERDPDSLDNTERTSSTLMRKHAAKDSFTCFTEGLPGSFGAGDSMKLFNSVRKGMGLKESSSFGEIVKLASVSETREKFVRGELFSEGDAVTVKETGEEGVIALCGSNYVIVELAGGRKVRKWLDAVSKKKKKKDPHRPFKGDKFDDRPLKYKTGIRGVPDPVSNAIDKTVNRKKWRDLVSFYVRWRYKNPLKDTRDFTKDFINKMSGVGQAEIKHIAKEVDKLIKKGAVPSSFALNLMAHASEEKDSAPAGGKENCETQKHK